MALNHSRRPQLLAIEGGGVHISDVGNFICDFTAVNIHSVCVRAWVASDNDMRARLIFPAGRNGLVNPSAAADDM